MQRFLFLLMLLFCTAWVSGQSTVSGTITDVDGLPLVGATIYAKGTSSGTVADLDGKYTLTVPEGVDELVISYTG